LGSFDSAPTRANTMGFAALFVEIPGVITQ
jgi:hypothetical protein